MATRTHYAHRYFAPLAKYFTVCITYQPPLVFDQVIEYRSEIFSGGQRWPVHTADNLTTFMCRLSSKSGNLSFLEPSGPLQAFNGIALTLPPHSNDYSMESGSLYWQTLASAYTET